jgi:hypothetical protein
VAEINRKLDLLYEAVTSLDNRTQAADDFSCLISHYIWNDPRHPRKKP